jgi:hypothetical protein
VQPRQNPFLAGDAAVGCGGGWVSKLMSSRGRKRLNRLERRCDWLQARTAAGESKGRDGWRQRLAILLQHPFVLANSEEAKFV